MFDAAQELKDITRRHFFKQNGLGIGAIALSALLNERADCKSIASESNPLAPKQPHFSPRVKNIIYLFMAGGPSHVDLFDPKPKLTEWNERPVPEDVIRGERFAFIKGVPKLLGSPYRFQKHGQSGIELSSLLPHLAAIADDLTVIRSMHTNEFNH
jgi:hypothetical protein